MKWEKGWGVGFGFRFLINGGSFFLALTMLPFFAYYKATLSISFYGMTKKGIKCEIEVGGDGNVGCLDKTTPWALAKIVSLYGSRL